MFINAEVHLNTNVTMKLHKENMPFFFIVNNFQVHSINVFRHFVLLIPYFGL